MCHGIRFEPFCQAELNEIGLILLANVRDSHKGQWSVTFLTDLVKDDRKFLVSFPTRRNPDSIGETL